MFINIIIASKGWMSFSRIISVTKRGGVKATIIADSVNRLGSRLVTYELEYPRFIHAEFMTHRLLSKNCASSRAIPVKKMISDIKNNTAVPIHWGKNQSGMQANEENHSLVKIDGLDLYREDAWESARDSAIYYAEAFDNSGYHKQIVNRLTEPFKMMKVVCSATEYANFFWLRRHKDAQPEIRELADAMYECRMESIPKMINPGEYHLPYVTDEIINACVNYRKNNTDNDLDMLNLLLIMSASCCAQVSYRKNDTSVEKALHIYRQLVASTPVHASPFEHQARPIEDDDYYSYSRPNTHLSGLTHTDRFGNFWSGNFKGWVQYRHEIPSNTCWRYA